MKITKQFIEDVFIEYKSGSKEKGELPFICNASLMFSLHWNHINDAIRQKFRHEMKVICQKVGYPYKEGELLIYIDLVNAHSQFDKIKRSRIDLLKKIIKFLDNEV